MAETNVASTTANKAANMYNYLKVPKNLMNYNLMRGVTDFSNLAQFDNYETGYSAIITITRPKFLTVMAKADAGFEALLNSYERVIEYEFKGIDNIEDISTETSSISNGITDISIITKVTRQAGSTVNMVYTEKSGGIITKVHEAYLRGLKDPLTQIKRYNGYLDHPEIGNEAGYEKECWTYLYFVTDNTFTKLEKAFLLCNCQPTKAELSIYNSERGDIQFKEVSVEMNTFVVNSNMVDLCAQTFLDLMNDETNELYYEVNSWRFAYKGANALRDRANAFGADVDYTKLPGPVGGYKGTSMQPAAIHMKDLSASYSYTND